MVEYKIYKFKGELLNEKIVSAVLTLVMVSALFTGCGHKHTAGAEWFADKDNHWNVCTEDGEKLNLAAHTLEEDVCTVCGASVFAYDDGTAEVSFSDENGGQTFCLTYNEDGSTTTTTTEYTYDSEGNMLTSKTYIDGEISEENKYKQGTDMWYKAKETQYEDGKKIVSEYNENNDALNTFMYDSEGNEIYKEISEFDERGLRTTSKEYENGVLTAEHTYSFVEDEFGISMYNDTSTGYAEDGSKTFVRNDEKGMMVEEIQYDASGNVTSKITHEYKYNENDWLISDKTFENDALAQEICYEYNDEGDVTREITYDGEGNKIRVGETTYTPQEDGSILGETVYYEGDEIK